MRVSGACLSNSLKVCRRCFSVGVTTAFGIVLRLDKLMVATKELVGEQYHIHGIGVPEPKSGAASPMDRPAKDA